MEASTLKFLRNLKKNNNKGWFDKNRPVYEAARADFEKFVQQVIDKHSQKDKDLQDLIAKKCMFRINRDVRFSKDKSPYKKNFAASMDKGGKNSGLAGYYFHLEPGNSFLGAGIWQPTPPSLKKIRQEIDYCADELKGILESKKFKSVFSELYKGEDVQLKKVPAGFEKDNPAAEYLRFRSWMVLRYLTDEEITGKNLLKITLTAYELAEPFIKFLNRPIESE
jgi:uncharacterized protein (TIGR02453 family)